MSPGDELVDRDTRAVADLLDFCEQAGRLVSRGRAAYEADEMLRLAAEALISRVGEAAQRLSQGYREHHPELPWRAIRGMRNLVAHDYGRIDSVVVWNTLESELPRLASALSPPASPGPADGG